MCSPIRYLFKGACIESCPETDLDLGLEWTPEDYFYVEDYSNYTCRDTGKGFSPYFSAPLSIKVVPIGYRSAIPKDEQTTIKIHIEYSVGSIVSI